MVVENPGAVDRIAMDCAIRAFRFAAHHPSHSGTFPLWDLFCEARKRCAGRGMINATLLAVLFIILFIFTCLFILYLSNLVYFFNFTIIPILIFFEGPCSG